MAPLDPEPGPPFTLWYRETRRHKWRVFSQGYTAAEILGPMRGSGEWYPAGPGFAMSPETRAELERGSHKPESV